MMLTQIQKRFHCCLIVSETKNILFYLADCKNGVLRKTYKDRVVLTKLLSLIWLKKAQQVKLTPSFEECLSL